MHLYCITFAVGTSEFCVDVAPLGGDINRSSYTQNMNRIHQLLQLRMIVRSLSDDAKKTLVQSFVSCRLDYCNALLFSISGGLIQRLQSVQNAAARLVTGASRCDHITPVLRQLHWLPVKQRIDFKLSVLVCKSLHGLAPPYLLDDCQLVTDVGRRHLRSPDVYTCVVPRTQSQIGDRSFSVAGPRLWNNLPTEIRRRRTTFEHYRRLLKAFLFV